MALSGKTWAAGEALGAEHRTDHNALPAALRERGYSAAQYGAEGDGATDDTAAIASAVSAAHTAAAADGRTRVVYLPPGTYLTDTISLSGKNVLIRGDGPAVCRLKANSDIAGYVLDLDGWTGFISNHRGSGYFGGFAIEGTGNADATLATGGLRMSVAGGAYLADITIMETGGPAMYVGAGVHLSNFDRVTLQRPVGADTNDVPYLHIKGAHNGNLWYRLGLRSLTSDADGSAAVLVEYDASSTTASHTRFLAPWIEFQHPPEDGAIFDIDAKEFVVDGPQWFDMSTPTADRPATGNCYVRFRGSDATGGNEYRGVVPGNGGTTGAIAYGVRLSGSRNRVVGVRGYRKNNVLIDSGVDYSYVDLGGSVSGVDDSDVAVVDNSGTATNWIVDRSRSTVPAYTPSNVTTDRTFDADSTTTAELADVLGTLIADLQDQGVIG